MSSMIALIIRCSSPRTRGYFHSWYTSLTRDQLFPAHAGVFPVGLPDLSGGIALPRARGGISVSAQMAEYQRFSSPRTRGYFRAQVVPVHRTPLFPAHAGVFPNSLAWSCSSASLPRARGGISCPLLPRSVTSSSSPRTRGYFPPDQVPRPAGTLFPAHAGVFPGCRCIRTVRRTLPRARGGISMETIPLIRDVISSPRTRGYFHHAMGRRKRTPTLPRARGGISATGQPSGIITTSSPRTRGYFWLGRTEARHGCLFPAHAGVFPVAPSDRAACVPLPRARGGISVGKNVPAEFEASSPRTRGYFQTHSGVVDFFATLPRARGGISVDRLNVSRMRGSSPRTRGYFQYASRVHPYARLFPARAGVFPAFGDIDEPIERSSPRTRGYFRAVKDP